MSRYKTILIVLFFIFAFCLSSNGVYAFGAGNIPSFAFMEGRAFRHGDIEDALAELIKKGAGGGFALSSLIGKGGSKFGGLDIKRVYFGNWLRDYSQAVDIAGLKKLQLQTIINLCMALGFLAHGYATAEFEVTEERLGVYLPTEHIDNPKGYGDGEDARSYNPKLRGPVNPAELEIDPRTGMKNYIANENGNWDTSKALVRRTIQKCIHMGRQHRAQGRKEDEYEAYRLLGQLLHTLEDFPAHSNFCELALVSLGHQDIFVHVGDQVRIKAPNGRFVAPLVTGTFGSSDFIHSLLGEATDHISSASVSDLNKEVEKARSVSNSDRSLGSSPANTLRNLFFSLPGGAGSDMSREMEGIERIRAGPGAGGKRPEDMSPQELHAVLWQVLSWRDNIVKNIENTIERIPGLGAMIEKLMDSISVFVFTTLEPFLKPILKTATTGLTSASGEVINSHDQYEVFDDPRASDPTHSFLSKDHFNLILNEPAGHLAKIILAYAVVLIIKAWDDTSMNVQHVSEDILQCLFHPDFHDSNSKIQREMLQYMRSWVQNLGHKQSSLLGRLTKRAVRAHENIRQADGSAAPVGQGTFAATQAHNVQASVAGYMNQIPGVAQAQGFMGQFGGPPGSRRDGPGPSGSGPGMPSGPGGGGGYTGGAVGGGYSSATSHAGGSGGPPLPSSGEAGHYYSGGGGAGAGGGPSAPSFPGGSGSGYAYPPPKSPPPFPIGNSGGGMGAMGIQPPPGPPPSFPGSGPPPSFPGSGPQSSYAPSYAPTSPVSPHGPGGHRHDSGFGGFPSTAPGFPGAPGGGVGGYGDYAPPPHGPPNPSVGFDGGMGGAWPAPGGPPPNFPGSDPYGPPQPQQHWHGGAPGYPGAAPQFPGSGGYGR